MKRSSSITFWTIFLFLISFYELTSVLNTRWYWYLFQYMPQNQIMLRFTCSLLGRVLLIIACIGLWRQKNWGRKMTLILLFINILTIPWKHPTAGFENCLTYYPSTLKMLDSLPGDIVSQRANYFPLIAMIMATGNLLINGFLIFFFTRKKIAQQFN